MPTATVTDHQPPLATGAVLATYLPNQKISAAAVAGALVTVVVLVLKAYGIAVPNGLEAALTTLVTFATGWIMPPGESEVVVAGSSGGLRSGRRHK